MGRKPKSHKTRQQQRGESYVSWQQRLARESVAPEIPEKAVAVPIRADTRKDVIDRVVRKVAETVTPADMVAVLTTDPRLEKYKKSLGFVEQHAAIVFDHKETMIPAALGAVLRGQYGGHVDLALIHAFRAQRYPLDAADDFRVAVPPWVDGSTVKYAWSTLDTFRLRVLDAHPELDRAFSHLRVEHGDRDPHRRRCRYEPFVVFASTQQLCDELTALVVAHNNSSFPCVLPVVVALRVSPWSAVWNGGKLPADTIVVREKYVPAIIGTRGAGLRKLKSDTNTNFNLTTVGDDPRAPKVFTVGDNRTPVKLRLDQLTESIISVLLSYIDDTVQTIVSAPGDQYVTTPGPPTAIGAERREKVDDTRASPPTDHAQPPVAMAGPADNNPYSMYIAEVAHELCEVYGVDTMGYLIDGEDDKMRDMLVEMRAAGDGGDGV
jgi:hypothetical protein